MQVGAGREGIRSELSREGPVGMVCRLRGCRVPPLMLGTLYLQNELWALS